MRTDSPDQRQAWRYSARTLKWEISFAESRGGLSDSSRQVSAVVGVGTIDPAPAMVWKKSG